MNAAKKQLKGALLHLDATERECVLQYVTTLKDQLAGNLVEIWLFGSAARGDMWPDWMPLHSDIDLLVLVDSPIPSETRQSLVDETYPLFLSAGGRSRRNSSLRCNSTLQRTIERANFDCGLRQTAD